MTSDRLIQTALVTGRIIHAGTGGAIRGRITITSPDGAVIANVRDDGSFAVSGKPAILFPNIAAAADTLTLVIRAESAQFRAGFAEQTVVANIPMNEKFLTPIVLPADVVFPADLAFIRGRVSSGADPFPDISGATVELVMGIPPYKSTLSLPDGTYAFDNVLITPPLEVRCTMMLYTTQTQALAVDYGIAVNEVNFRLKPA